MLTHIGLTMAWRNLWRHRRRTWLTLGAMIFSSSLLVFMMGLQVGSYSMMIENSLGAFTGHLQLQAPGYHDEQKMRMTLSDVQLLAANVRESLGTERVGARAVGFAMASSAERSFGIQITGVQPHFEATVSTLPGLLKKGRYLEPGSSQEIVIGTVLARNLKVSVGSEITLIGSGYDGSIAAAIVDVVGIFQSDIDVLDRSMAQMPLSSFQETFSMGQRGHSVVVAAPNLDVVPQWKAALKRDFGSDDRAVLDWNQLQPGLKQAIQADMSSAAVMYFVLIVLVAFSVLNTQLMSVLERTREFGIVMALGVKPSRLSGLVVLETCLLSTIGLAIGVLIGAAITGYLNHVGFTYPGMEEMASKFGMSSRIYPPMQAISLLLGPASVFVGAVLASFYPALKIHRLRPVQAMRAV